MAVDERFGRALRALSKALAEVSAPSMIIGGIAVNVAGFVRGAGEAGPVSSSHGERRRR